MSVSIPFIHDLTPPTECCEKISPLIRRVLCPNSGPYTYTGTGTFIIGTGNVAVIDPGPKNDDHLKAILNATSGESISHILVSHTHADHSPLAMPLAEASGAKTYAFGAHNGENEDGLAAMEEGVDKNFTPDHKLKDGDMLESENWTIKAIHTPGHTSNHMCFAFEEENTLFTGDHIMAWSTSIIIPPDGDMASYMNSLEQLLKLEFTTLRPTHGPAIIEPRPFIEALMAHRMDREDAILKAVVSGISDVKDIVASVYHGLPENLHNAAAMSALAHLILLVNDGRLKCDDKPSLASRFYLG
ncbi:MAG: MBL fold metallo-hydrolase [Sphingomonadales bacterium]|nr:MBL fold metallo-hydrolase [Sphingomonadales bacterium]